MSRSPRGSCSLSMFNSQDTHLHKPSLHSREEELNSIFWSWEFIFINWNSAHKIHHFSSISLFNHSLILVCTGIFCLCLGLSCNIIIYFFGQIVQHDHWEFLQVGTYVWNRRVSGWAQTLKEWYDHRTRQKLVRTNRVQGGGRFDFQYTLSLIIHSL